MSWQGLEREITSHEEEVLNDSVEAEYRDIQSVVGEQVDAITVDDNFVEWYLRKRRHIESDIATIKAQAEQMQSPLHSKLHQLEFRWKDRIEEYIRQKAYEEDKKTLAFWGGTFRLRTNAGGAKVTDSDAALRYAMENELHTMLSEPQLRLAEYRKYAEQLLRDEGELLPGVEVTEPSDSMSLKIGP